MKVFVWKRIEMASDNYHSEGGLVVFAETLDRAREVANATSGVTLLETEMPDDVRSVSDGNEAVYVMPDAGCC